MPIPIIDERIRHVGVAHLRSLNRVTLRELSEMLVIQDGEDPLAVVIPMAMYLEIQGEMVAELEKLAQLEKQTISRIMFDSNYFETAKPDAPVDLLPQVEEIAAIVSGERPPSDKTLQEVFDVLHDSDAAFLADLEKAETHALQHHNRCGHCLNLFPKQNETTSTLCPECFSTGHRNGSCMKCEEADGR